MYFRLVLVFPDLFIDFLKLTECQCFLYESFEQPCLPLWRFLYTVLSTVCRRAIDSLLCSFMRPSVVQLCWNALCRAQSWSRDLKCNSAEQKHFEETSGHHWWLQFIIHRIEEHFWYNLIVFSLLHFLNLSANDDWDLRQECSIEEWRCFDYLHCS